MKHRWILKSLPHAESASSLAQALGAKQPFPLALAQILLQRGVNTFEEAKYFFRPTLSDLHDPYLLTSMDKAVERLVGARKNGEKVLFFGDYDVDGTTAVTTMCLFAEDWGIDYDFYIPDRYIEGYGVSYKGIDYAVEIGASVVVTLDCGIKAMDQLTYAYKKGLDVIVCDHHKPGPELPPAIAILDPLREDCSYPCTHLTGCGVALKLAQALAPALIEAGIPAPSDDYNPVLEYADLATLSIACDIVPILDENRIIAFHGLQKIRSNPLPGLRALMDQAQGEREWNITDLVFFVGPRINSAGRLSHAREAVEVMMGKSKALEELAQELQQSNDERKLLDKEITQEALAMIAADPTHPGRHSTVLYNEHWHKGVIGIVASRVVEHHYRPTIMLTESDGKLVGSARSVSGFDLYHAIDAASEHLIQFGGHTYAAGLTMKKESFSAFCKKFDQVVAQTIREDQKMPSLFIDLEIGFSSIDARLIKILGQMEPFGPGNRRPVFYSKNVLVRHSRIMKEDHIRLVLEQEGRMFEAVGFGLASKWQKNPSQHVDIAYQPVFNTWKQEIRINLHLKDVVPSHEASITPMEILHSAPAPADPATGTGS